MSDPPVLVTQVPEQISVNVEDGDWEKLEVYNPENEQVSGEEEEASVHEVLVEIPNDSQKVAGFDEIPDDSQKVAGFDEIPDDSQKVAGLASQIEEVPNKSYTSIVSLCSKIPSSFLTLSRHLLLYHRKCHSLYSWLSH